MTNQSDLPLNLYKANTELQLRVVKLVMENWKKWLELSSRAVDDGIAESQARVEQLLKAQDWTSLAASAAVASGSPSAGTKAAAASSTACLLATSVLSLSV